MINCDERAHEVILYLQRPASPAVRLVYSFFVGVCVLLLLLILILYTSDKSIKGRVIT